MGCLKNPCTTSYWSSIETMALNCLVFLENCVLAFRRFRWRLYGEETDVLPMCHATNRLVSANPGIMWLKKSAGISGFGIPGLCLFTFCRQNSWRFKVSTKLGIDITYWPRYVHSFSGQRSKVKIRFRVRVTIRVRVSVGKHFYKVPFSYTCYYFHNCSTTREWVFKYFTQI